MKRYELIQALIDRYSLSTYLEIGVFKGDTFSRIKCDTKHSVDPTFEASFEMTSDRFFSGGYGANWYDMIFIDGLHTAEQTFEDISNAYQRLAMGGFIVVHDCNPLTKWHTRPAEEYKRGEEWNGTTYEGYLLFKQYNPGLNYMTVDTDYGCAVISERNFDQKITWDYFDANRERLLNLVTVYTFKANLDLF